MVTCGDNNMAENVYHTRVSDIQELKEIIEDVFKGKERMVKSDGTSRPSQNCNTGREELYGSYNRRDRRESDRRRDTYRNTPQITLADASVNDLTTELQRRDATRGGNECLEDEYRTYDYEQHDDDDYQFGDASTDGSLIDNDRYLAAANEGDRRAAAKGTHDRSDNRRPRGNVLNRERCFIQDRQGGVRSFGQDSPWGGMHSAHYCNKRCMFCKQVRDAGQCEHFRNFQDLVKFVRTKGTKEGLPPELKSVVQERHLD
ncbi:hypothetical protein PC128_g11550 [Phytophthora cactorum]|nr:hypothetical protein PC128_g11550 [Phytophthora cactorum]